ncbi:MAG TPA: type II secretion system protein [Candidatus Acidoferrales bacterium]|nr:type II secretion system protein [Candidatus Acidoferrales bacterium]
MRGEAKRGRRAGFTLLEVVVAMTIVGLGIVTVLEVFSLGLRLSGRSVEVSQARLDGQSVMDEALVYGPGREESGSLPSGNRWRLRAGTVETPLSLGSPWSLEEISVEVRYRDMRRENRLELKTLVLTKKASQ